MILDLFRKDIEFYNIQGYDDIKDIVRRALDAEDNYNLPVQRHFFYWEFWNPKREYTLMVATQQLEY
jgi:hypothetical protein